MRGTLCCDTLIFYLPLDERFVIFAANSVHNVSLFCGMVLSFAALPRAVGFCRRSTMYGGSFFSLW
jgi:hypothetical protein